MSGSVNKVILVGNLGRDPESRTMPSGDKLVSFSLATTESWRDKATGERKDKTEWHNVVIFNENLGRVAEQYCKKGSKIYIEGQLQTREYTDKGRQPAQVHRSGAAAFPRRTDLLDSRNSRGGEEARATSAVRPGGGYSRGGGGAAEIVVRRRSAAAARWISTTTFRSERIDRPITKRLPPEPFSFQHRPKIIPRPWPVWAFGAARASGRTACGRRSRRRPDRRRDRRDAGGGRVRAGRCRCSLSLRGRRSPRSGRDVVAEADHGGAAGRLRLGRVLRPARRRRNAARKWLALVDASRRGLSPRGCLAPRSSRGAAGPAGSRLRAAFGSKGSIEASISPARERLSRAAAAVVCGRGRDAGHGGRRRVRFRVRDVRGRLVGAEFVELRTDPVDLLGDQLSIWSMYLRSSSVTMVSATPSGRRGRCGRCDGHNRPNASARRN